MSALPRGKINITEHMVVYPDGRCISLLPTTDTKSEEPVTMDLDITSMPIVSQDVGITENVNTLPAPAVEQTYSTNVPTTLNSASLAINKPLLLLTGESNMNPNGTALKTYSPKCKDAKLSVNTCKTYCNLRSSARMSNKPIAVTTGINTLLPNSSSSVIPAKSSCSRPSYENSSQPAIGRLVLVTRTRKDGQSRVQLNTYDGRALDSHSTFFNTINKQDHIQQQKNPKTTSTCKVSGKPCILPSVVNRPAPLAVFLNGKKVSLIITKPRRTGISSGVLCIDAKFSLNTSKTLCRLKSSRARLSNKPIAVPTGSNTFLSNSSTSVVPAISPCSRPSYENSSQPPVGRFVLVTRTTKDGQSRVQLNTCHGRAESPTTAKNIKPQGNVMIPSKCIIIKGSKGQIVKKLVGVEKLIRVEDNRSLFTAQAGNVLFPCQPIRSQDILTTALANSAILQDTSIPSIDFNLPPLTPNGVLNSTSVVGALKSPIMTAHELSNTNTKIISDGETNILSTDVSGYVPIPITITHQEIVQSAFQQHLLDTSDPDMPFSDTEPGGILFSSTQVSSPSSVSLPILNEDTTQQQTYSTSSISMPSLNEDYSMNEIRKINDDYNSLTNIVKTMDTDFPTIFNLSNHTDFGHLSPVGPEPPFDIFESNMFDRYPVYPSVIELETNIVGSSSVISPDNTISMVNSQPANINEDSREIPAKPDIVTDLSSLYTTNSPFLTTYSSDQPMDFSKRYNEDESSDESPRKKPRYF